MQCQDIKETWLAEPATSLTAELTIDIFNDNLFLIPVPWDGMRRFRIGIAGPNGDGLPEAQPVTG